MGNSPKTSVRWVDLAEFAGRFRCRLGGVLVVDVACRGQLAMCEPLTDDSRHDSIWHFKVRRKHSERPTQYLQPPILLAPLSGRAGRGSCQPGFDREHNNADPRPTAASRAEFRTCGSNDCSIYSVTSWRVPYSPGKEVRLRSIEPVERNSRSGAINEIGMLDQRSFGDC